MEEKTDRLFDGFPPVSSADWDAKIREDLKGADYEKKLIWNTPEGFRVKPFYTGDDLVNMQYLDREPGSFPYLRGNKISGNAWEIRQDFRVSDITEAVQKIRMAMAGRITSIGLDTTRIDKLLYPDFQTLIRELDLSCISLNLTAGNESREALDNLIRAVNELNINSESVRGSLDYDPMGRLTTTGGYHLSEQEDFYVADHLLLSAENELPGFRVLPVNSYYFGNAGSTAVQELAFGLAIAAEYLDRLSDMGHDAGEIARHIQWNLGVGSSYFIEIAKVRSARLLFSNLMAAYGEKLDAAVFINSITASWNKTLYDAYVNILRLTTESMSAVLGGCDSLLVRTFDSEFREPGNFSERISRNIQFILKEESYLDKVADPAGGSYYVETLTESLAEHAWQLFLRTEAAGGYIKAFTSGFIREEVQAVSDQRRQMLASRREVLLGTNEYPNLHETMDDQFREEIAFPAAEAVTGRVAEPLLLGRAAQEFEMLRLTTEKFAGGKPAVFNLTCGNLAMRIARSQFSTNFFACAGYEVIDNLGFKTPGEGVDAALASKAQIIVVCSSDEEYRTLVPEVFKKVNGKALVVVAGAPACMDELKKMGINEFIHVRSNVLDTLRHFNRMLGIGF
jgi:methylmalonyl-CoA mutase